MNKNDFWATQTLAKILWAGISLWRPGVDCTHACPNDCVLSARLMGWPWPQPAAKSTATRSCVSTSPVGQYTLHKANHCNLFDDQILMPKLGTTMIWGCISCCSSSRLNYYCVGSCGLYCESEWLEYAGGGVNPFDVDCFLPRSVRELWLNFEQGLKFVQTRWTFSRTWGASLCTRECQASSATVW